MGIPFFQETAPVRTGPGTYEAAIDPVWNLRPLPQGGIVTALALRAMGDALDRPEQTLRTLHTAFVAQVAHGPVRIEVDVLRTGRSMSHVRAEVANDGQARGHITTAIFGSTRTGFDFTDLEPPADVAPPDQCRSFRDPVPPGAEQWVPPPFWTERVDGRVLRGHAPWDEFTPDRAERVIWYRFDEPPYLDDGTIDPAALVVMADMMPGAVAERIGPQERMWFAPSVDLTVHILDDCRSPWVLGHNRARFAGDGYASADMALWDYGDDCAGPPRLVAYATQLFLFTFLD